MKQLLTDEVHNIFHHGNSKCKNMICYLALCQLNMHNASKEVLGIKGIQLKLRVTLVRRNIFDFSAMSC